MEQQVTHPSAVPARLQATAAQTETTHAEIGSQSRDFLIGIGAILIGWAVVATWLMLFISCIVGTRVLVNAWL